MHRQIQEQMTSSLAFRHHNWDTEMPSGTSTQLQTRGLVVVDVLFHTLQQHRSSYQLPSQEA